jgi:carboxypeptidase Q
MARGIYPAVMLIFLLVPLGLVRGQEVAQHPHAAIARTLLEKGMRSMGAMTYLERLTSIGHRLAGSKEASLAVEETKRMMEEMGLDNIHLEAVEVSHWERGPQEEARIMGGDPLSVCALGGSVATPAGGLVAEVIEVCSLEECDSLGEKAKGRIVFFNRPMDPTLVNTFNAYGGAADQRVHGAARAAAQGAVAVLVRSLTLRHDDVPHTGIMRYDDKFTKIPAAALGLISADQLHTALSQGPVSVHLAMGCKMHKPVVSHNVVGQLTGIEKPDEIIALGGHLDSWDQGTGAHDDGAGCMQSIEALRLLKEAGLLPKRTIRVVMFMDEEFGGVGGRGYAADPIRKTENHVAAIESDRGGFLPLGFTVNAPEELIPAYRKYLVLFEPMGMFFIKKGFGGVDIRPLEDSGTVTIGLYPDSQRYFDVHHSANDVISSVNKRELEIGAVAMAVFAYALAQDGVPVVQETD